jgi:chromosomal replication initiator protein
VVINAAWQNVLEEIKRNVQPAVFVTWFKDLELLDTSKKEVVIGVPSVFYVRQMEARYYNLVSEALKKFDMEHQTLRFVVDAEIKSKVRQTREPREAKRPVQTVERVARAREPRDDAASNLNPRYTFDNFVVGKNNDMAVSAAKYIVEHPGEKYNPYYLFGGPGLGKTHLIQAIGNELQKTQPRFRILYVPTEKFYSSFIAEVRAGRGKEFADKYRKLDVLIIDDIQMITGKTSSQEEFFNTFNELYQRGKQIIISSDRMPGQIATLDKRLSSRLAAGLPVDIQMPDFETRCAILKAKAEYDGVEISDEAVQYIAENIRTNVRELEGRFNQLMALSEVRGLTPDEIISDGYIVDTIDRKAKSITPKRVLDCVSKYYHIGVDEMRSESRARQIALPRQVAMYILAEDLAMSTPKIATELGRKDHTTAMHSIKKIRKDIVVNFQLREDVTMIRQTVFGER